MVQAVKFMDEIISNQGQNHNIISSHIGGAIDTFNQSVKGASDELSGRTSLLARGFAKEKGNLSNQDITRVQKMLPSRFDPVETNVKKRNDYIAELSKTIDAKLSNVPQKQRDMIKKKVGLFDIGLASVPGASKPTNSSPAAAGAATHIWTPDGVQPVGVSK